MKLEFPESFADPSSSTGQTHQLSAPTFSPLASFRTIGVVMNVFLLDPACRLLAAFVWVSSSNTIGLFALLDWDKREYVFVDTGIECVSTSSHTCICAKRKSHLYRHTFSHSPCLQIGPVFYTKNRSSSTQKKAILPTSSFIPYTCYRNTRKPLRRTNHSFLDSQENYHPAQQ